MTVVTMNKSVAMGGRGSQHLLRFLLLAVLLPTAAAFVTTAPKPSKQHGHGRMPALYVHRNKFLTQVSKAVAASSLVFSIVTQSPVGIFVVGAAAAAEDGAPSVATAARRYWDVMHDGPREERIAKNEALLDYAVGTINTMYYDNSGGALFQPPEFYQKWRALRDVARGTVSSTTTMPRKNIPPRVAMDTREGAVQGLKWLVSCLNDPFSSYLTREELREELSPSGNDGFLGLGAMVEVEYQPSQSILYYPLNNNKNLLSATRVANLPIVSAVVPHSPAERAGLTVGDRIVAIGDSTFLGETRDEVRHRLRTKFSAENYVGHPDITIAKPVWRTLELDRPVNVVVGYRPSRVRLPTTSVEPFVPQNGDSIVQYELLSDSIMSPNNKVGYIRLTRFSRGATAGYLKAIEALEAAGAQSYIIDIRNNYGGIIQEAMLTASTLLRDPHAVLCYTMNSRGGFTPHDVEEYVVDKRYPGYLLSKEPKTAALDQVRRESPEMFVDSGINWVPPSSFASLSEQRAKRGIHVAFSSQTVGQIKAQKKVVLLINEGTASSSEVFASSLHDNGRLVALVGTKSYGKGLIQHTFPMPDGGGLRLTVAEYLTPTLHHVTKVGSARYDSYTGAWVGGGIQPDIICDSRQGIPGKVGADLCVGIALDALAEANSDTDAFLQRVGNFARTPVRSGIVRDDF